MTVYEAEKQGYIIAMHVDGLTSEAAQNLIAKCRKTYGSAISFILADSKLGPNSTLMQKGHATFRSCMCEEK